MVYVIQVCRQLSSRTSGPLLSVQWINSWWWTEELPETCRVPWQNKFVKLVHLVSFIIKKCITMHGHMNVKYNKLFNVVTLSCDLVVFCFTECTGKETSFPPLYLATSVLGGVSGQRHAKLRYRLYRRLGEPQGRLRRREYDLLSPGFEPRTVQSVPNLYHGPISFSTQDWY